MEPLFYAGQGNAACKEGIAPPRRPSGVARLLSAFAVIAAGVLLLDSAARNEDAVAPSAMIHADMGERR